jgi:hypothetical protein
VNCTRCHAKIPIPQDILSPPPSIAAEAGADTRVAGEWGGGVRDAEMKPPVSAASELMASDVRAQIRMLQEQLDAQSNALAAVRGTMEEFLRGELKSAGGKAARLEALLRKLSQPGGNENERGRYIDAGTEQSLTE